MAGQTLLTRMKPRCLAIRSRYSHHAAVSGYSQILRFIEPVAEIGEDETASRGSSSGRRYRWMYEWDAWREVRRQPIDIIHILYAEEYFRFMKMLCPRTPLVLTFHQPPAVLERELEHGDAMGRAYKWTHCLTRNRFRKVDAAIVTNPNQIPPLSRFIPAERIHHIPLGVAVQRLVAVSESLAEPPCRREILTVGNWRRDWPYYFSFVAWCREHAPDLRFTLVNRKLEPQWAALVGALNNLRYLPGASDESLFSLYHDAAVQFLPFEGVAGNNSVNEGLAFGCPIVTNASLSFAGGDAFVDVVPLGHEACLAGLRRFLGMGPEERSRMKVAARAAVSELDWGNIAARTIDVYRSVI